MNTLAVILEITRFASRGASSTSSFAMQEGGNGNIGGTEVPLARRRELTWIEETLAGDKGLKSIIAGFIKQKKPISTGTMVRAGDGLQQNPEPQNQQLGFAHHAGM